MGSKSMSSTGETATTETSKRAESPSLTEKCRTESESSAPANDSSNEGMPPTLS